MGRSRFDISLTVNTEINRFGCEIYMRGDKTKKAFALLRSEQEKIEDEIGVNLDWHELSEGQDCRIILYSEGDIRDKSKWGDYFQGFQEHAEKFHAAFSDRIKRLKI